jgi:hypothetical protein
MAEMVIPVTKEELQRLIEDSMERKFIEWFGDPHENTVGIDRRVFLTALEHELAKRLAELAHKKGISTETLINVWLTEKIEEMA